MIPTRKSGSPKIAGTHLGHFEVTLRSDCHLTVSPIGSSDAFTKLATPCTILSLRAVTASFVFEW